ncbi:MAG: tRNA pseudouridine(13) synthase TruD [Myxococcales bacterium]
MAQDTTHELPLVTAELPGTGGVVRATPEDFEVEELPAYEPGGAGPHLYLLIQKRGRNTRDVARELARLAGVPEREVGYAGLKDRHALTRQWFSVPVPADDMAFEGEGWSVLRRARHGNKLRTGHLRGNRFTLRLRDVCPDAAERARAIADALRARGLPNFYGEQRFGRGGNNVDEGLRMLRGARGPRDRFQRRMLLSAVQARLFNEVLAERMRRDLFDVALAGDVLKKLETGGLFVCADPAADTPRVRAFEVSPTGPMFGHRMMPAAGAVQQAELAVLDGAGLTFASFRPFGPDAEGTRRPMRLPLDLALLATADELVVSFTLPKGSYATVVLRELMKAPASVPEDAE